MSTLGLIKDTVLAPAQNTSLINNLKKFISICSYGNTIIQCLPIRIGLHQTVSPIEQCCGSITFWYGSGSAEPYQWLTDPDSNPAPAPAFFVSV
jgi:hypothetical protein